MSLIEINNLTFGYDGSFENVFTNASFSLDTDWKLGFTGRNGRGKTTLLKLLMGEYEYKGSITSSVHFDYFPYDVLDMKADTLKVVRASIADFDGMEARMEELLKSGTKESLLEYGELLFEFESLDGYVIDELIKKEISKLSVGEEVLYRPFETLSNGERTKILLAALFLKKNNFLLIDEPTNHLDLKGRDIVAKYLNSKKTFIIVSHDKRFIDSIIDHVLVINKGTIDVQKGNYSTFSENKKKQNEFEVAQNKKIGVQIDRLEESAKRNAEWSDKVEASKIGEHCADRGRVGHLAAKMMKRSKNIEGRIVGEIEKKKALLKDIEYENTLSVSSLDFKGKFMVEARDFSINYGQRKLFDNLSFSIEKGDRVLIKGSNGSGKSSIIKLILGEQIPYEGYLKTASNLVISYVCQDTTKLCGTLEEYAEKAGIDQSLFKTILIKIDFVRSHFDTRLENFSEGQKKKAIIAASLATKAQLYIWDEPLNFIDIISREQIEALLLKYAPTMLFVEHDGDFAEKIATKVIEL